MHIGIDARFYGPQVKGLGRYTEKLLEGLSLLEHDFHFTVFLNKEGREEFSLKDDRFTAVEVDIPWYGLAEQKEFPKILQQHNLDLMHFPHFNVPYLYRKPFVATIHDLILLDHPSRRASTLSWPKYQLKYLAYRLNLHHLLKKAEGILTVSEYVKHRIAKKFPFAKDKITVTYLAGNKPELSAGEEVSRVAKESAQSYGINKPYLLYVGNAYPHKNLEFLVEAFHQYWQQDKSLQLVLVGKRDYFYNRLEECITSFDWGMNPQEAVRIFGYATEQQLVNLYQRAQAYVFPSLEEGFGLPPLEAMQHGLPVLSSNRSCLPEILGDAALYFNPQSTQSLLEQLNTVLKNEAERNSLIQKGFAQTAKYDWQRTASQTLAFYQRILNSSSQIANK